jgi:hypothetical protein
LSVASCLLCWCLRLYNHLNVGLMVLSMHHTIRSGAIQINKGCGTWLLCLLRRDVAAQAPAVAPAATLSA